MKGVVIAGTGSGAGKTSIATGLMSVISKRMNVQPYKVGPDFIDTMYHSAATGNFSRNLDAFMNSEDTIRNLVGYTSKDADLCIIEGVRGLYEGISATSDQCSTAQIAKILGLPVVLVMDVRSLTRSTAAILNGFRSFDKDVKIGGVILNNVSGPQHEEKLRTVLREHCEGVNIIGVVGYHSECALKQRHLGLSVIKGSKKEIEPLEILAGDIDIDQFLSVAEDTDIDLPSLDIYCKHDFGTSVAIPMDAAYCFYYRENIECLQSAGMDVKFFSPLNGDMLPNADVYYIGGGYPELYLEEVSSNKDFMDGLKSASDDGKAIIGECGGLMTMCQNTIVGHNIYKMSGIFNADAKICGRHGPKYVVAKCTECNKMFNYPVIRGHEFHYSSIQPKQEYDYFYYISRGTGIIDSMDGITIKNSVGSYMYQHCLSMSDWASGVQRIVNS
ncbi:MAG: hydrogenobyrinic acid a,c-diamide synthase (glutamine-hydrolyzing) [archaeon]|nr:hydrogenobyrinic acid a,c-diamide synthase (glutamine-hydrolyzing) [archaeon]